MGIVLDIILVLFFILSIFLGYKKGLTKVLFRLCSFFIALVLMLVLYKPVASFVINNTNLDDDLKYEISEKLQSSDSEEKENVELKDEDGYPSVVKDFVKKYVDEAVKEGKANVIDYVSEKLAIAVVHVIVAIVLYIVINVALLIVGFLANIIVKLPILKQIDKTGGIVYGIVRGILLIYVILAIASVCSAFMAEQGLQDVIKTSYITKYFYENNIILNLLVK